MDLDARNLSVAFKRQRPRPACTSTQSDQHLCNSISTLMHKYMIVSSFLTENLSDRQYSVNLEMLANSVKRIFAMLKTCY